MFNFAHLQFCCFGRYPSSGGGDPHKRSIQSSDKKDRLTVMAMTISTILQDRAHEHCTKQPASYSPLSKIHDIDEKTCYKIQTMMLFR